MEIDLSCEERIERKNFVPICWAGIWPPGPPPPPDMLRPWSPRCCIVPLLTLHHSLRSNRHRPPPQAPPLSHR